MSTFLELLGLEMVVKMLLGIGTVFGYEQLTKGLCHEAAHSRLQLLVCLYYCDKDQLFFPKPKKGELGGVYIG